MPTVTQGPIERELRQVAKDTGHGRVTFSGDGHIECRVGGHCMGFGIDNNRESAARQALAAIRASRTLGPGEWERMQEHDAFAKAEADVYDPPDDEETD